MNEPQSNGVLDAEVVASLKELDDGQGSNLFLELVDIFVEDAGAQVESLRSALESGDLQQIERSAHSLKSSCANIGATHMSQVCFELEKRGRSGSNEGVEGLVGQAQSAYQDVCCELKKAKG